MAKEEKQPAGRPPKPMPPPIPDTFENVLKALVRPMEKKSKDDK